jgi:hypothetical protein
VKQWDETHSIFYNFNLSINWVLVSIPMAQPTELSSVTAGVDWGYPLDGVLSDYIT